MTISELLLLTVEGLEVVLGEHVILLLDIARITVTVEESVEDMQCPFLALPPL